MRYTGFFLIIIVCGEFKLMIAYCESILHVEMKNLLNSKIILNIILNYFGHVFFVILSNFHSRSVGSSEHSRGNDLRKNWKQSTPIAVLNSSWGVINLTQSNKKGKYDLKYL